jgi:hypothetical protein
MLQFTPSTSIPSPTPRDDKHYLAWLRRIAKRRGLRILKDWSGYYSVIETKVQPPSALMGLWQVSLNEIDTALSAPAPVLRRTSKPVSADTWQEFAEPAELERVELEPVELTAAEVLQEELDASAVYEKLKQLKQKWGR